MPSSADKNPIPRPAPPISSIRPSFAKGVVARSRAGQKARGSRSAGIHSIRLKRVLRCRSKPCNWPTRQRAHHRWLRERNEAQMARLSTVDAAKMTLPRRRRAYPRKVSYKSLRNDRTAPESGCPGSPIERLSQNGQHENWISVRQFRNSPFARSFRQQGGGSDRRWSSSAITMNTWTGAQ